MKTGLLAICYIRCWAPGSRSLRYKAAHRTYSHHLGPRHHVTVCELWIINDLALIHKSCLLPVLPQVYPLLSLRLGFFSAADRKLHPCFPHSPRYIASADLPIPSIHDRHCSPRGHHQRRTQDARIWNLVSTQMHLAHCNLSGLHQDFCLGAFA